MKQGEMARSSQPRDVGPVMFDSDDPHELLGNGLVDVKTMFHELPDEFDDTTTVNACLRPMFAFSGHLRRAGVPMDAMSGCPPFTRIREWSHDYRRALELENSPRRRRAIRSETLDATRQSIAQLCLGVEPSTVALVHSSAYATARLIELLPFDARDAVVVWDENPTSNGSAWGFRTQHVHAVSLRGASSNAEIVERFALACRAVEASGRRIRVLALNTLSQRTGLRLPLAGLCKLGRRHGAHVHVDATSSWGAADVSIPRDVNARPHSLTASAHVWLCGPHEAGFAYIGDTVAPQSSAHSWVSRIESNGPLDDPKWMMVHMLVSLLHERIDIPTIERAVRDRATQLTLGLEQLGVEIVSPRSPELRHGVVVFEHADNLGLLRTLERHPDHKTLVSALYVGPDRRPCIRLSPHVFNNERDVERVLSVLSSYPPSARSSSR